MKQYFKKSKVFKKYKDERIKDQVIDGQEEKLIRAHSLRHFVHNLWVDFDDFTFDLDPE